jgi:hypothetical protein
MPARRSDIALHAGSFIVESYFQSFGSKLADQHQIEATGDELEEKEE